MDASFGSKRRFDKWIVFLCASLCIAAVGLSWHFFSLQKKEKEKRVAVEDKLRAVSSELRLLMEKNRELADQLREAKRIAEEFAREKEGTRVAALETRSAAEGRRGEVPTERGAGPQPQDGLTLADEANAFRREGMTAAAGSVNNSASKGWRAFRMRSVAPLRSFGAKGSLGRVGGSAGKAIAAIRGLLASRGATQTASLVVSETFNGSRRFTATNEELRRELEQVRREKRELESEIAKRTGGVSGSVDAGQGSIRTGRRFSGKVLVVNQRYNFVVIDIGKEQGLEKGELLIVHRGNRFIGKAQVIKVYEKMAAADLVMDWMQDKAQVSDGVKKF